MNMKYGELKGQLDGIRSSVEKMEYGMEVDKLNLVEIELEYMMEKFEKISREIRILKNSKGE